MIFVPNVLAQIVYRTNTFPLVHTGFLHTLFNLLALTPLLERFEAEHGTLTSLLLFFGRRESLYPVYTADISLALSTIPAVLYTLLERGVLRGNSSVVGAR